MAGEKDPVDFVADQEPSSQSSGGVKTPGNFMSFYRSSSSDKLTGPEMKEEGTGREGNPKGGLIISELDGPREGAEMNDLYSPQADVSGGAVPKQNSNGQVPSSDLDGNREGAEMNDLYSPAAGGGTSTSDQHNSSQHMPNKTAAGADEHERRGEEGGSAVSRSGLVEVSKGMANEVGESFVTARARVMEKLSLMQLPSESLEGVRKTFETGLKGAYTTTRDAVQRTKQSILDILPSSLSSSSATEARKVVEDMEKDMLSNSEAAGEDDAGLPTSETAPMFMRAKL